jgi:hypothetical protein
MRHLAALLAIFGVTIPAQGLVIGPAPSDFALDGLVQDWRGRPPAAKSNKQYGGAAPFFGLGSQVRDSPSPVALTIPGFRLPPPLP